MTQLQKEVKKYLKEIKRLLAIPRKEKKQFLPEFENSIDEYITANKEADYDQLVAYFGTPAIIAQAYTDTQTAENCTVLRNMRIYRRMRLLFAFLLLLCFILLTVAFIQILFDILGSYIIIFHI